MQVISSRWTFFYKRVFPVFWFGFIALFIATALLLSQNGVELNPMFLVSPVVMAAFGWFILRRLAFDLADEVVDADDALIVRKGGAEARIALADIVNVDSSVTARPPRITLTLRTPGRFGRKIAFLPPSDSNLFTPFAANPTAEQLIDRIDRARSGETDGQR